jgi:hypothetical protein
MPEETQKDMLALMEKTGAARTRLIGKGYPVYCCNPPGLKEK